MKIIILIILFSLIGCSKELHKNSVHKVITGHKYSDEIDIPISGKYYSRYHEYLSLNLNEDDTFDAYLEGDMFKFGDSRGKWLISDSRLVLFTEEISDFMVELDTLYIYIYESKIYLIPSHRIDLYNRVGITNKSALRRNE